MRNDLLSRPWSAALPRLALALACASVASASAGACGGEDPAPAGPGPIPIESLRLESQKASCEHAVRCGLMPDDATCLRLDQTDPALLQLLADVVYGRVTYDASAARACVEARRAETCESLASARAKVEEACRGVFVGSVAEGGPCLVDGECAAGGVCDRSMCADQGACCLGACAAAPQKAEVGGDCSTVGCVEAAYCDVEEAGEAGGPPAATCKERIDNGQDCTASNACKEGQRCARNGDSGKCFIQAKEGESCNPSLADACLAFDTWCEPTGSTCAKLPGVGQPCATGDRCQAYATCDAGTCALRPVEGGACPEGGPACLGDLRCVDGACAPAPTTVVCAPSDVE